MLSDAELQSPMRVVIADDAVLLREGLVRLLTENGHDVVAAVGDGDGFHPWRANPHVMPALDLPRGQR